MILTCLRMGSAGLEPKAFIAEIAEKCHAEGAERLARINGASIFREIPVYISVLENFEIGAFREIAPCHACCCLVHAV
jgi:hypothetical protein